MANDEVVYLATLQFSWGGLFDAKPADGLVHLVRGTRRGTPGDTLCGANRFNPNGPGWSVGGGVSGPKVKNDPCADCCEVAGRDFGGLPVAGLFRTAFARLGFNAYHHSFDPLEPATMNRPAEESQ